MSTNNTYCYSLHQMVVGWFRRRPVNPLSFLAPAVKVDGDTGTYDYFPQDMRSGAWTPRADVINPPAAWI